MWYKIKSAKDNTVGKYEFVYVEADSADHAVRTTGEKLKKLSRALFSLYFTGEETLSDVTYCDRQQADGSFIPLHQFMSRDDVCVIRKGQEE